VTCDSGLVIRDSSSLCAVFAALIAAWDCSEQVRATSRIAER